MVPAEYDKKGTCSGRDESKAILTVGVRVKQTTPLLLVTDLVLSELIETIKRREVKV